MAPRPAFDRNTMFVEVGCPTVYVTRPSHEQTQVVQPPAAGIVTSVTTMERKIVATGGQVDVVAVRLPLDLKTEPIDVKTFHLVERIRKQRHVPQSQMFRPVNHLYSLTRRVNCRCQREPAKISGMATGSAAQTRCALCGAKDVSEPGVEAKYCHDCWEKKIAVEDIVAREFSLKRYIRAHSAEKYLVYHSTLKRPCGQTIVVDDGYDLFLTLVLYPSFAWEKSAYYLEGDPDSRAFSEILVDLVAAEIIEPWGGGKWHLEIFRSSESEPEDWNGEM